VGEADRRVFQEVAGRSILGAVNKLGLFFHLVDRGIVDRDIVDRGIVDRGIVGRGIVDRGIRSLPSLTPKIVNG